MVPADVTIDPETGATVLTWVGADERGENFEVVAIERSDCYLVIHVMPTHYRRRSR